MNKETEIRCARILAKRFAETLVFWISDPRIDDFDDAVEEDKRDIADVIAGVPQTKSVSKRYSQLFLYVHYGLRSYTKSVEVLSASDGVECCWEASFTENFKTQSNLSSDFDSLRQLIEFAITRDMVKANSPITLANRAEEMLNRQLVDDLQETAELRQKGENFVIYLLSKIVA